MKLFQQFQELATKPISVNPNTNLFQKLVKGSTLAVLSTTTSLSILLASINSSNNLVTSNSNTYDPTSLVSNLTFSGQSATAQVVSNGKAQKLDIKLIKTNKDGSQEYKVNGKTIKVTKKQIDTINLEIKKFYANEQLKITSFKENDYKKYIKASMVTNNDSLHIKFNKERNAYLEDVKGGKVVSPVALQLPAFVAGLVAGIQSAIGAYSFQTTMFLTRVCFVRPDNCAKTLVFAWQGSGVAINQLQKWSKGQN